MYLLLIVNHNTDEVVKTHRYFDEEKALNEYMWVPENVTYDCHHRCELYEINGTITQPR